MVSIKLIQLNMEGSFHLDACLPFLAAEQPDVVCLQEVFERDVARIQRETGMAGRFVATCDKTPASLEVLRTKVPSARDHPHGREGVLLLSRLPCETASFHYFGPQEVLPFTGEPTSRVLVHGRVEKEGASFFVATTHFTWTPDGACDDTQRAALAGLLEFDFSDCVLCGDFNAPRPGEVYEALVQRFTDNVPPWVDSTIDPTRHRNPNIRFVVDYVFTTPQYVVEDFRLVDGVSDHKALVAVITRRSA